MFTVCPKCALTLAVTAADLRAGQGYVRCGRCANVFNALLALAEEAGLPADDGGAQSAPPAAVGAQPNAAPRLDSAPTPAAAPAAEPAPASATAPAAAPAAASAPTAPAATAAAPPMAPPPAPPSPPGPPSLRLIESPPRPPTAAPVDEVWDVDDRLQATGTFETIVLEGDTFLQTEELVPEEALDSELADVSRRIAAAHQRAAEPDEHAPGAGRQAARAAAAAPAAVDEAEAVARLTSAPRRRAGWPAIAGASLLGLLLVLQMLNHWRDDLAVHAGWYAPLSRIAGALGEPLQPNWDLAAYDVRQLGASTDATDAHALRVRLSLANHGERAQGLPLLRLTLLDRYGKALSSGELSPAEYLPAALGGRRFIDREQRIDTEVRVLDATQQASSFELDVCLRTAGGALRCAGDAALAASHS